MDTFRRMVKEKIKDECYKRGDFTLSSGKKSEHYLNCKPVTLNGDGIFYLGTLLLDKIYENHNAKGVAGMTLGADPLVTSVVMLHAAREYAYGGNCETCHEWVPHEYASLIVRKEPKGHGTQAWIEGPELPKGSEVIVLEDVVTTGASSIKAVEKLREHGYVVNEVLAVVDRHEYEDTRELWKKHNLNINSLFVIEDFMDEHQDH
tara:strand:+ start:52 stop:666 length:615 start_codon:yes stop_codon:yes gene_type:complete